MRRYAQRSVRPLIHASLAVLVLSLLAPWMWRAVRLGPTPAIRQGDSALINDAPFHSVLQREVAPSVEVLTAEIETPISWEPAPSDVASRPEFPLDGFEITPFVAEIVPPVTELIELDPSLSDLPDPRSAHTAGEASTDDEPADMPMPEDLEAPLPPPVERAPPILPARPHGVWPFAESLVHQLQILAKESPGASDWAMRVIAELEALASVDSLSSDDVGIVLSNLHKLAEQVRLDSAPQPPSRDRTLRLRAGYAVVRRLAVWDYVAQVAAKSTAAPVPPFDSTQLAQTLQEIDVLLGRQTAAQAWRTFLRLDDLQPLSKLSEEPTADQRTLARDVLARLSSPRLDQRQHEFVSAEPFCRLAELLAPAAQDPIDWAGLLAAVERHELADSSVHAGQLAEMYQVLRWSADVNQAELSSALNENYRNANVRLAISEELINRFIPAPQFMAEPVVDTVRGADVVGRSESLTKLRIVLLPDRLRWKLGLEARGDVASETESSKGPARFWTDGLGQFNARKQIVVDRRGLSVDSAQAHANAEAYLTYFETDFDGIPLFGSFARSIARQQFEQEKPAARFEIEEKISGRATARLNQEVDQRIRQAEREFQQQLIAPLDRLNLEPTPVDMQTTARRIIVRYRLAGPQQLSAHTPRPQAPGNSVLSLQIHQSVMNNVLENLKLDNRRVDLRTLYVEMLQRFEAKSIVIPEDLPEDVTVHFAEHDAVRISNEEGRVRLTIRLKELDHAGKNVWRNFEVRGYYRPSDNQLEANLVRDGNIELVGERLKLGDQIALRGIFARVLSRNRQLSIVNKQLLMRPQLADLQVTQFVIQDGWVGVALGPKSDNMRPAPLVTEEEVPEITRRPLRNLFHGHR